MKKNILKKLFIKISKIFGYEIIDQAEFISPTLDKKLNDELSIINEKSIILPLGEVKITRKTKSILIILRINTEIEIWDQNKKRLFELPKIEYTLRSLNSLIKSINFSKKKYPNINFKITIVDDNSKNENILKINELIAKNNINVHIVKLNHSDYINTIKKQKSEQTFSNLCSLLKCYEIAKEQADDLVFFIEDDYLHFEPMIDEMIASYERISSQLKKDLFMCPADYPYLYMNNEKTNILIGNKRHWRTVDRTLCSFMTSKKMIEEHWEKLINMSQEEHSPFESPLHEIYEKEICLSPIPSLAIHCTNINSVFGLSPNIDWKKIWNKSKS